MSDETGLPRMFHRQRRRGCSRMSCGGDGESEDGGHQCRQGYVKRCAPALLVIVQAGHGSQHYSQAGDIGPRIAGKLQYLCSTETIMKFQPRSSLNQPPVIVIEFVKFRAVVLNVAHDVALVCSQSGSLP